MKQEVCAGPIRIVALLLSVLGFAAQTAGVALAHPLSFSSAVVDVTKSGIKVDLEIMVEDLVLYHRLQADGQMKFSAADLLAAADKHQEFLLKYFNVLDANGNRLQGKIQSSNREQIDKGGVGQTELMRRTVGYTIVYELSSQPNHLTFFQNFGGVDATLPAVMDLYVLQNGKFFGKSEQIAHGKPHTVEFDWNQPADAPGLTFAELRKQRAERTRSRLGIGSYSGLYSFLYINRFEVRHEVLIPLVTLEEFLKVERSDPDFLEVAEQKAAEKAIETFFQGAADVRVNGQPCKVACRG